ncbi:hypothetical protein P9314_13640 [Paenibacillus validus]|uniref:Uncharacterized protein n=1 Tax=Paenibacillus validus TaxID=44253 RepID=A0A7X2ZFS5_9BACL|nr:MULTISPECIES: hypothetical protein [Paenibacillus]MED4601744.1 hypothetical protein [Paenibacillus validus]MED4605487.1 hypothetical protein [Paenibacillus validus]MUG73351.1 hypothetical protein [Paenibacillus validus]
MMTLLAVIGGVLGLAATGSAFLFIWMIYSKPADKSGAGLDPQPEAAVQAEGALSPEAVGDAKPRTAASLFRQAAPQLLQWTFFDYVLLALFLIGSLFLFTDLVAVLRDSASYPPYHYGYLLCGFVFTFAAALMMLLRLALVLALARGAQRLAGADHHQHEPNHAEHAK